MSSKSKSQLRTENSTNFPNNNSQFITPEKLRGFNGDIIDSLVVSSDTGSYVTTSSFDNGTRIQTFTKADGTTYTNTIPGGNQDTGSFLETASFDNSSRNMTFTKADASTFNVNIPDATVDTGSFARTDTGNTFTTGSQIIQSNEGIILQTDGGGITGQVQLTPGTNVPSKFTPAKLTGLEYIDMIAISSSTHYLGKYGDDVRILNNQGPGGSPQINFKFSDFGASILQLRSGSNSALFDGDVIIQGNVTSSISKQNVIVTPQTITDNITISTNNNALVLGDTTFAGTVTIEGDSELSIFDTPALGELIETASISGQTLTFTKQDTSTFDIQIPAESFDTGSFLTTSSYEIDSASFDTRIDGNASLTNNNTLTGNQIVSGSLTAVAGMEVGNLAAGSPAGNANLGVMGQIILRSGSGIVTDGAFGTAVPFDSTVAFFNGIDMQGTDIGNSSYIDFNAQDPLPGNASGGGGRLAVSGSNLYFNNGTTWTKIN